MLLRLRVHDGGRPADSSLLHICGVDQQRAAVRPLAPSAAMDVTKEVQLGFEGAGGSCEGDVPAAATIQRAVRAAGCG